MRGWMIKAVTGAPSANRVRDTMPATPGFVPGTDRMGPEPRWSVSSDATMPWIGWLRAGTKYCRLNERRPFATTARDRQVFWRPPAQGQNARLPRRPALIITICTQHYEPVRKYMRSRRKQARTKRVEGKKPIRMRR